MKYLIFIGFLAALGSGCDDDTAGTSPAPRDQGMVPVVDSLPPPPDAEVVADMEGVLDAALPEVPEVSWIEVSLAPRQALFTRAERPQISARVFDRIGREVTPEVTWTAAPPGSASVEDGSLIFHTEGQGIILACVGQVCGRSAFFVDDGPPTLLLDAPEQAAVLTGFGGRTISVRGRAVDSRGSVSVRVNGLRADLANDGSFSLNLAADFGLNRIEVQADDGVRQPPVTEVRELLWAPSFLPVEPDGSVVPGAVTLRMDQALLDHDGVAQVPEEGGALVVDEIAGFLSVLLGLVDGSALLPNPQIANSPTFSLRINDISLGRSDVDAGFTEDGMELFISLPAVVLQTQGTMNFEGQRLSLDGTITASLAAFAQMDMRLEGGRLVAEVREVGVAVEGIQGAFADPVAGTLVSILGNQFGDLARGLVANLVEGVVQNSLPGLVENALGGILASLEEVPLGIDANIEGVPPIRLLMRMQPVRLDLARRLALRLNLDASIRHPQAVQIDHPDPGVPVLSEEDEVLIAGNGLGVTVRLALVNALLHEVWRGGTLKLRVPVPANLARLAGETYVDAVLPPVIVPARPGSPEPLVAQLGAMRLTMQPEGLSEPHVFQVSLAAGIEATLVDGRFRLGVAEVPTVHAVLIHRGDGRDPTLGPDALELVLRNVLWPQIRGALQGGLNFGLDGADLNLGEFVRYAPRVRSLRIEPVFEEVPEIRTGRLRLEGGLDLVLDLAP